MSLRNQFQPKARAYDKIAEGLAEAIAIAKGEETGAIMHVRPVGRPTSGKQRVTLLLEPDVIEKFRATGPGWQARMNDVLKTAKV